MLTINYVPERVHNMSYNKLEVMKERLVMSKIDKIVGYNIQNFAIWQYIKNFNDL